MNFRKATNKDVTQVQNLVFSVLLDYGLKPDPAETDKDLSDFEKHYFSKNGYFEVCEVDNEIVGTWGIHPTSKDKCELRKMYLSLSSRGKGLGKTMLERAMLKAKELGYKKMELETASVLKEAISLYAKYGFKPSGRPIDTPRCDQAYEIELR